MKLLQNKLFTHLVILCTLAWEQVVTAADLLTNNPQLKVLQLTQYGIDSGETFAAALREHISLEVFEFTDKSTRESFRMSSILKAIHNHRSLKRLQLNEGCYPNVSELAAVVKVNRSLQELFIHGGVKSDKAFAILANGLRGNKTLKKLAILGIAENFDFRRFYLTNRGMQEFVSNLQACSLIVLAMDKNIHVSLHQVNTARRRRSLPILRVCIINSFHEL